MKPRPTDMNLLPRESTRCLKHWISQVEPGELVSSGIFPSTTRKKSRTKANSIPPPISRHLNTQIPLHPIYRNRRPGPCRPSIALCRLYESGLARQGFRWCSSPLLRFVRASELMRQSCSPLCWPWSCLLSRPFVPNLCLIFIRRGPENRRAGNSITHTILRTNGQPAAATIRGTAYRA